MGREARFLSFVFPVGPDVLLVLGSIYYCALVPGSSSGKSGQSSVWRRGHVSARHMSREHVAQLKCSSVTVPDRPEEKEGDLDPVSTAGPAAEEAPGLASWSLPWVPSRPPAALVNGGLELW